VKPLLGAGAGWRLLGNSARRKSGNRFFVKKVRENQGGKSSVESPNLSRIRS
jgi:hypothetical protein